MHFKAENLTIPKHPQLLFLAQYLGVPRPSKTMYNFLWDTLYIFLLRNEDGGRQTRKLPIILHSNLISDFSSSAKYFLFLREMRKLHLTETECARHVCWSLPSRPRPPHAHTAVTSASQTEILSHLATGSRFSQLSVIMELRYGMRGTSCIWPQLPGCPFLLSARGRALASGHNSPHL